MSGGVHYPEEQWKSCDRCPLSLTRRRVVLRGDGRVSARTVEREGKLLYWRGEIQSGQEEALLPTRRIRGRRPLRGKTPIILFIGEAPGLQEDITGLPFQGEAGRVFNLCLSYCHSSFDFEITNIVGCRPTKQSKYNNTINREPSPQEITACLPRLEELVMYVPYDGIVYLGSVSQKFKATRKLLNRTPPPSLSLKHPSYILRQEFKLYEIKEFARKLDTYVNTNFETE